MGHAGGAGAVRGGVFASRERPRGNLKPSGQLDRLRKERDEGQLDRIMADLDSAMSGVDDVVRRAGGAAERGVRQLEPYLPKDNTIRSEQPQNFPMRDKTL